MHVSLIDLDYHCGFFRLKVSCFRWRVPTPCIFLISFSVIEFCQFLLLVFSAHICLAVSELAFVFPSVCNFPALALQPQVRRHQGCHPQVRPHDLPPLLPREGRGDRLPEGLLNLIFVFSLMFCIGTASECFSHSISSVLFLRFVCLTAAINRVRSAVSARASRIAMRLDRP